MQDDAKIKMFHRIDGTITNGVMLAQCTCGWRCDPLGSLLALRIAIDAHAAHVRTLAEERPVSLLEGPK